MKRSARLDPIFKNYVAVMDVFVSEAETRQERNYLQVQVHAGIGCNSFGFQKVLSPFFQQSDQDL